MVDGDPVEGDGREGKEECHTPHGAEEYTSTANAVDEHQVYPREEEVRSGDDGADRNRVGESDESEERR